MDDKEIVIKFILGLDEGKNSNRKSTLRLALEQARHLIGFDRTKSISNGQFKARNFYVEAELCEKCNDCEIKNKHCSDESDLFAALTLYFIALDQLGDLFGDATENKSVKISSILKKTKLKEFEDENVRSAIESLRNSLCHNFGLANNRRTFYKFSLDFSGDDGIVNLPQKQWNGTWSDKSKETQTIVNVFPLCNAIEKVIKSIVEKYENGELSCVIDDVEELKTRFTLIIE